MALGNFEQVVDAIKTRDIEALASLDPKDLKNITEDISLLRAAVGAEIVDDQAVNMELARIRGLLGTIWFWAYTSEQLNRPVPFDIIRKSLEPRAAAPVDPDAGTYGIC